LNINEDDRMKNFQLKEKKEIIQDFLNPISIGIQLSKIKMKFLNLSICEL